MREIREIAALNEPPQTLAHAYSEVDQTFHPSDELQKVLEVDWSGYAAGESWKIRGFAQAATEGIRYKEIIYYYRTPSLTATGSQSLSFALLDPDGLGVSWALDPPGDKWKKITVRLDSKEVYIDNEKTGDFARVDQSYGSLSKLEINMSGYSAGTIYIDELHLKNPDGAFGGALEAEIDMSWPGVLITIEETPFISDFALQEKIHLISPGFSPLYGRPSASWDTYSNTHFSIGLFFAQVDIDFEVAGVDDEFDLSGGHRIGFPKGLTTVYFTESYFLRDEPGGFEFNRANTAEVAVGETGSISAKTEAFSWESLVTQSWRAAASVPPENWSSMDLELDFSKTSVSYLHNEKNYFSSWFLGYRFVVPRLDGGDLERLATAAVKVGLQPIPVGFEVETDAGYHSSDIVFSERSQANNLSYSISALFEFADTGGLEFSTGYRRNWDGSHAEPEPGGTFEDIAAMLYRFSTQSYLIDQVPVWEFYSNETRDTFVSKTASMASSLYHPEFFLSMARDVQSHWLNLLLPSGLEFSFGRTFEKNADLYRFFNTYDFYYLINAINLFGEFGAYPLFSFYSVDEIFLGFTLAQQYNEIGVRQSAAYRLDSFLSFESKGGDLLAVENYLRIEQTLDEEIDLKNTTKVGLDWSVYPPEGLPLPFLDEEITRDAFVAHADSLSLTLYKLKPGEYAHPTTIVLSHETLFRYPEHGSIKAQLALGLDVETYPAAAGTIEEIFRFVFMGAIEGKIEF